MQANQFRSILAAALFVVPTWPAEAQVFDPETFTLDNGLETIVITNRMAPVALHMLWYKVGAADELPGRSGIAHLLEHMMFLGTGESGPGEFSTRIALLGGNDNAFTSWDATGYHQQVAIEHLEAVMGMEADRIRNLDLDPDLFVNERDVAIEERRQRVDNDPSRQLNEQVLAALYRNHPYGIPVIGWEEELARLTPEDAQTFYDTWYAPNNAVLVVHGDIDAETLRPMVERTYGQVPAGPPIERVRPEEPEFAAERRVILRDGRVEQENWRRFYPAPSYRLAEGGEAYALQLLDEILGAGSTSRLYRALVVEQQLANAAGTFYTPTAYDGARFGAYLQPVDGVSFETLEAAFEAELERLIADGLEPGELAAAQERRSVAAIFARDDLANAPRVFGRAATAGQTVEDVEAWPDRINAVTEAEIIAAAERVLRRERSVTGLLLADGD